MFGEDDALLGTAGMVRVAENDDLAGTGFGQEDVAVWSDRQQAGPPEIFSENVDVEALRYRGQKTCRCFDLAGAVAGGLGREWRGQIRILTAGNLGLNQARNCDKHEKCDQLFRKRARFHGEVSLWGINGS